MRSRFSTGWRCLFVTAAAVSLILLPFSQAVSGDRGAFVAGGDQTGGPGMIEKGEDGPGKVITYSRANYTWPYASGPYYGDARQAAATEKAARDASYFHTPVGVFDLSKGMPNFPAALSAQSKSSAGVQYLVIQLDPASAKHGAVSDLRSTIEETGGSIVRTLPDLTYIARVTPAGRSEIQRSADVMASLAYPPAVKLHPSIGRIPLVDPVKALSEVYSLDVRIFPGEDADAIAQSLSALGGNVSAVYPDTVRVDIHRSKLAQVAKIEGVELVFEYVPPVPLAEETTTTVMTGRYNNGAVPYHDAGVDGGGDGVAPAQIMMVLDTGIQLDAGDLSDTRTAAGTPGMAHRKVLSYSTTNAFNGLGDSAGCDEGVSGGFTHGHLVAAVALGNATNVDLGTYGLPWLATDPNGNVWRLDGVAKGAKLIAYDAQPTPAATSCQDPLLGVLFPGDLYSGGTTGSMGQAYAAGARIFNFSFGTQANEYESNAMDVDQFLIDKGDAMAFIAVGNDGLDADNNQASDPGTMGAPATSKNALAIGASRETDDLAGLASAQQEERAFFSGTGPAPGNRIAPQLLAPGDEAGGGAMGLSSEFGCRSSDNDQLNPVECDVFTRKEGTSFSTPAVAGAGLIVRDYFAQGFYPDGTNTDPGNDADRVPNISGALVKAILISSAQFLTGDKPPAFSGHVPGGDGLTIEYRFNIEQGYGRVKLDNALPLEIWPASSFGLLVHDLVGAGPQNLTGLIPVNTIPGQETVASSTFRVCNGDQPLRIALAWFDEPGQTLVNNIDLRVTSPSDKVYHGNYFTDDDNRDGVIDVTTEDCPSLDGDIGDLDASAWSLPACEREDMTQSPFDTANPTEAITLSPDPAGDESIPSQIEIGEWTIEVIGNGGSNAAQTYAVSIAGGVCQQSWAQLDANRYTCNSTAALSIYELDEMSDPNPSTATVQSRTTIQVVRAGVVVDEESVNLTKEAGDGLKFTADALVLTDGTQRDFGNGALDVRDGDTIRAVYADTSGTRTSEAPVNCTTNLGFGAIVFAQFGQDTTYFVAGGCERNARGNFEFGFPDRYMDAGESLSFNFAFASDEAISLNNVDVDLRCVIADTDSPADCRPNSIDCADPNRSNNLTCDGRAGFGGIGPQVMTIQDSPKTIGLIRANSGTSGNFTIQMEDFISGTPEVDMILLVEAPISGRTTQALAISRHTLDVDENSVFYSTDWPQGGMENFDSSQERAGDEILQNPTTNVGNFQEDYRFETKVWSDLTAGGTKNTGLLAPWNFDRNDGGFRSGLLATTDEGTINDIIAQWGEDKNFNNVDDRRCTLDVTRSCQRDTDCAAVSAGTCESVEDRDPASITPGEPLDKAWNTRGGCGWQTRPPGTCTLAPDVQCFDDGDCDVGEGTCDGPGTTGGIWHTGLIGGTTGNCLAIGDTNGQCQSYEVVGGTDGVKSWREHLITPIIQKVNGDDYKVEIVDWRWNQAVDLADSNTAWVWEFDTDVLSIEPVDLFSDNTVLNGLFGTYGSTGEASNNPDLTNGFSMFAPLDQAGNSWNGSMGNNRVGQNSCFFEGGSVNVATVCPGCPTVSGDLGFTGPLDNDADDDGDGMIDEYVMDNGPVRNMDMFAVNGPDMRFSTFEDLYGDTQEFFQGSIGIWTFERTATQNENIASYGVGVDDMVVEWREFNLVQDTTDCATGGECAVVDVTSVNTYEGSSVLTITVVEKTPDAANDCNLDGTPDGTRDCDGDGTDDLPVLVSTDVGETPPGEIVYVNLTSDPFTYVGTIPVSAQYDSPGVLFIVSLGGGVGGGAGSGSPVNVTYRDNNDGTGSLCRNDVDPAKQGRVQATTNVFLNLGRIAVIGTQTQDNGDQDAFADTNETVDLRVTLTNKGTSTVRNLSARLATNDPKISCVLDSFVNIGDVPAGATVTTEGAFRFQVAPTADRTTAGLDDLDAFSAQFQLLFASDDFDATLTPQFVTVDLDLDASGGSCDSPPCFYFEGWENLTSVNCLDEAVPGDPSTAGQACRGWQAINIDSTLTDVVSADGYRCQYSDPDWPNSGAYAGGVTDCFLGTNQAQADRFWWQINTPTDDNGGKAYTGSNSLYMGEIRGPDIMTTPVSVLEYLQLIDPINLGLEGTPPFLKFKHQVDFMDDRNVNVVTGKSPARGVVSLQLADAQGDPVGDWIRLEPFQNVYDSQAQDQYFSCSFDPIDDGNNEDSFFDPTDPDRLFGPSTSCSPQFAFVYMGETFSPFSAANVARGEPGSGLEGETGIGTWLETQFALERFKGRSVRLRFLYTDLKAGSVSGTWEDLFTFNPSPGDDGWWIDDIEITSTLDSPATISVDDKDNSALPNNCGANCSTITPVVNRSPATNLLAPGQVVEIDAVDSTANRCLNGTLQYQFWADGNGNGQGGDGADTLLRGWTDNPTLLDAPNISTSYVVDVRCSTATGCSNSTVVNVGVNCPTSGSLVFPTVLAPSKTTLDWGASETYNWARGSLATLSASYPTTGSGTNNGPATTFDISADAVTPGNGNWYLFRRPGALGGGTGFCNDLGTSWGTVARDSALP